MAEKRERIHNFLLNARLHLFATCWCTFGQRDQLRCDCSMGGQQAANC